jgi:hypothetical protein
MRAACATLEKSDALTLTVGEPATNFTVAAGTLRWDVAYDAVAAAAPYSVDDAKAAGVLGVFRGVRDAWATWCNARRRVFRSSEALVETPRRRRSRARRRASPSAAARRAGGGG